ncbi:hypothetical protein RQP46_003667 [Phenoliferia psychrophenolica]
MTTRSITSTTPSPGVLVLTLKRPPVNAFNQSLFDDISTAMTGVNQDPTVRVVIFTTAIEKFFSAGLDLKDSGFVKNGETDVARKALLVREHMKGWQDSLTSIEKCRVPVIAAISGICYGAGVDLSSACDIRLAASNTTFSIKEVDIGIAADVGTLQRFPKACGNSSLVKELAYTGRPFDAREAHEIGFLSRVVQGGLADVLGAALVLAKQIATKSPVAIVSNKHLLNYSYEHTIQEGLEYTSIWNAAMTQTEVRL